MTAKERDHAVLAASSARKWLNCTASALLEDSLPDSESEAAKKGELAHAIGELKLTRLFTDKNMTRRTFNTRLKKLQRDPLYEPEMERNTEAYADYVKRVAFGFPSEPTVAVEKRVDYSRWARDGFGTSDCILIHGSELHVIDYKNGRGVPVFAEENPQMKLYALGALDAYGLLYPISKVVLHVVQPNLDAFTSWGTTREELLAWGESVVRPAAEKAMSGEGEYVQGEWCDKGFCRARATCRARMDANMAFMAEAEDPATKATRLPPLIGDEEVGYLLKRAQFLASWVKRLEEYALDAIVAGGEIPGWKAVEGRSVRTITDTDAAFERLKGSGYEEAVLYERKPITLTAVEKLVDKDAFQSCVAPYIEKPPGKPTLAPADDKRPAMQLKPTAEEAFGGDNQYKKGE